MHCSPTELSRLLDLLKFLEKRAQSLSTELVRVADGPDTVSGRPYQRLSTTRTVKCNHSMEESKCQYCQCPHKVTRCPTLLDLPPEKRFDVLRKSGLCFNCLRSGHMSKQCPSGGCRQCGRRHNTIFCRESQHSASLSATRRVVTTTSTKPQPCQPLVPAQTTL